MLLRTPAGVEGEEHVGGEEVEKRGEEGWEEECLDIVSRLEATDDGS